jgi:DNA-directed RNA polymerase specialized sigma24 family protein
MSDVMDKPKFQIQYKQQGTTEKQAVAAEKKREEAPTSWRLLCEFFVDQRRAPLAFLLLASQRRTEKPIDEIAARLEMDEWELLAALRAAEIRLLRNGAFARRFSEFLEEFDGEERAQAVTVQDGFAMTYEEIGLELGIAWQRAQQIEQEALAKLRKRIEQYLASNGRRLDQKLTAIKNLLEAM